jgi:hypothetical protein
MIHRAIDEPGDLYRSPSIPVIPKSIIWKRRNAYINFGGESLEKTST